MRPIDADELKDNFSKVSFSGLAAYGFGLAELYSGVSKMLELIDEAPTIETVKRGEWVEDENGIVSCSACKHEGWFNNNSSWYDDFEDEDGNDGSGYILFDHCPYCGAKMGGGVNELD